MAANQYMQPFFDSLSQGVQVAQSLRQASMQQQQLQEAQREFNARQALSEQEAGLQQNLDKASMIGQGATPVDASGNVNVPAPQPVQTTTKPPVPIAGSTLLDKLNANIRIPSVGLANTGQTANVPADASKPTVSIGGSTLQPATPLDKLNASIAAQRATEQATWPTAKQIFGDDLPPGADPDLRMSENQVGSVLGSRSFAQELKNRQPQATPVNEQQQALETAAQSLAQQNGIKLDSSQPTLAQLPLNLRQQAFGLAKQMQADPDIKGSTLATQESARATQAASRATMAQTQQLDQQRLKDQQSQAIQLNPAGKKALEATEPVLGQIDELRAALEQKNPKDAKGGAYKDDNNPLTLAAPMLAYRAGIKTPDGELGSKIGDISLNAIQGAMPFASKSRNYQWIKDIKQHLPSLSGLTPDSPALIYQKLGTVERNFLRMKAGTQKYETAKTAPNPSSPMLQSDDAQRYYKLAGGDPKAARQMATQDGWTIPEIQ